MKTINTKQIIKTNTIFYIFIFTLLVIFSPFKLLAYLVPFFALVYYMVMANVGKVLIKFLFISLTYAVFVAFTALLSWHLDKDFFIQNSIIAFVTYGSFIFLFSMETLKIDDTQRFTNIIKNVILIEATVGILQILIYSIILKNGFDGASGDIVQGTINIFSFLSPTINFNNPIYCVNLVTLIIFYLPHIMVERKSYWIAILGILALIMASVIHIIFAFIFAFIFVMFFFYISKISQKTLYTLSIIIVLFFTTISLFYVAQPDNFKLITNYYKIFSESKNPKAQITQKAFTEIIPNNPQIWTGLGAGQFTSRASLIGTGRYFSDFKDPKPVLPMANLAESSYFKDYVFELWDFYESHPEAFGGSSMAKPFYSNLSILAEFGLVLSAFFFLLFIVYLFKLRNYFANNQNTLLQRYYALGIAVMLVFLFLISFIENYLEITQAVFLSFLCIIIFNPLKHKNIKNIS